MSTERPPLPVYHLTLEALPDAVPAGPRLAGLLKVALRAFGFRCREARELPPAARGEDRRLHCKPPKGGQRHERRSAGVSFFRRKETPPPLCYNGRGQKGSTP